MAGTSSIENIVRITSVDSEVFSSRHEAERVEKLCQQGGLWTLKGKDGDYPEEIKPVIDIFTQGLKNGGVRVEQYAFEDEKKGDNNFVKLEGGGKQVIASEYMVGIVEKMWNLGRTGVFREPNGRMPGLIDNIINVLDSGIENGGAIRTPQTREEIILFNRKG